METQLILVVFVLLFFTVLVSFLKSNAVFYFITRWRK